MCRRSRDNALARNAIPQTKLATQNAASNAAVWRQRAGSLPAVPAFARPEGMAGPKAAAGALMVAGSVWISRRALYWSGEIPAGPEPRRRGHSHSPGSAVLFCRTIWFSVSAFPDRRRYFARGDGAARSEKQSRRSVGKSGGSDFGFYGPGSSGWGWRRSGAGGARSREP